MFSRPTITTRRQTSCARMASHKNVEFPSCAKYRYYNMCQTHVAKHIGFNTVNTVNQGVRNMLVIIVGKSVSVQQFEN